MYISSYYLKDPQLLHAKAFINGVWMDAADGATFSVKDPALDRDLGQVANLGLVDVAQAIQAAQEALPSWRAKTGKERARILRRWFDLIVENADDLAAIITAEQGKPLPEARDEVLYGASFIEWFAEEGKRVNGDVLESPARDKRLLALKQPIGVCAAITPWNFPVAMITRKVGPALAAGCTIVVKPAEQTPFCALAIAELAHRAGLPAGVLNIVPADRDRSVAVGKLLCESPTIRHLSFTGSTPVGRILMRQSASTVKKLALELGGHAPFVVFEDADIDAAVEGALISKYRNAGQTCVCTNRFYVHTNVYDNFVEKLTASVEKLQVGNGFHNDVKIGPLITETAIAKVQQHVDDAVAKGATIVTGGLRLDGLGSGHFYAPTVLRDATAAMAIAVEETFGPVAAVFRFQDESEVLAMANSTEYGLAAYVYTRDVSRFWRMAEALEFGMVGFNTGSISNEVAPFGGIKQSGLGREGSRYGIDEYLEIKAITLGNIL